MKQKVFWLFLILIWFSSFEMW